MDSARLELTSPFVYKEFGLAHQLLDHIYYNALLAFIKKEMLERFPSDSSTWLTICKCLLLSVEAVFIDFLLTLPPFLSVLAV